jgi:acetyltransferase-like isoleucine patch superfamily enzyme
MGNFYIFCYYLIPLIRYNILAILKSKHPKLNFLFRGSKVTGILAIGNYCKFLPFSRIKAIKKGNFSIGNYFSLGDYSILENQYGPSGNIGEIFIGNHVSIGAFSFISCPSRIIIGNDTIIGQYFSIHAQNHNFERKDLLIRLQGTSEKGVIIGSNCWIGSKVTILDGVTIDDNSVIGAGSVVTKSFPANRLIVGCPARAVREI